MPTLDFSLKVSSPAFVSGGMEEDVRNTELRHQGKKPKHRLIHSEGIRVPSLRGTLRFWFRAMNGHLAIRDLHTIEGDIFGDTERGQGLRMIPTMESQWIPEPLGMTSEKDQSHERIPTGSALAYLGYGPLNYVNKEIGVSSYNKFAFRDAIPPGSEFHFRAIGKSSQIDHLKRCLILLHLFGGLGARSRRAWGSVEVKGGFLTPLQENESVQAWFGRTLREVWDDLPTPSTVRNLPDYSCFTQDSFICFSSNPRETYQKVMDEFFGRFRETRLYNINNPAKSHPIAFNDHKWEVRDATSKTSDIENVPLRLAFGMPYGARARNKAWGIEYKGYYDPDPANLHKFESIDRRASALFLKVFRGPDQMLYAVALFLKASFFGRNDVKIGKSREGAHLPFPGWQAVESFLQNPKWQRIRVP